MLVITTQSDLDELTKLLVAEPAIGIDTEFERQYYYLPKLSTIQMVTKNYNCIIDYLSLTKHAVDLKSFKDVIYNKNIIKVLHSGRQDLEILYNLFKELPKNIFDTQVAANICGLGRTISYGNLCFDLLSQTIDKQYQRSDWIQRPLPLPMLEYALTDVKYLLPLYEQLHKTINEKNLADLFQNAMDKLLDIKNFEFNPQNSWKKVKFIKKSATEVYRMKKIAALREELAKHKNIPRRHFATDEDLVMLCNKLPINRQQLTNINLTKRHFDNVEYRNRLFAICRQLKTKNKHKL